MAEYDLQSVSDLQNSNGGLNMKEFPNIDDLPEIKRP